MGTTCLSHVCSCALLTPCAPPGRVLSPLGIPHVNMATSTTATDTSDDKDSSSNSPPGPIPSRWTFTSTHVLLSHLVSGTLEFEWPWRGRRGGAPQSIVVVDDGFDEATTRLTFNGAYTEGTLVGTSDVLVYRGATLPNSLVLDVTFKPSARGGMHLTMHCTLDTETRVITGWYRCISGNVLIRGDRGTVSVAPT